MIQNDAERPPAAGGMLTGEAIRSRDIVANGVDSSWRAASYDLCIGKLINPAGEIVQSYVLPPRGIVEVISRERIAVPADLSGVAMVKTSLCNEGILALGIGLIDPGWDGPISSFLINFGRNPQRLAVGQVFLRATFHKLDGQMSPFVLTRRSDEEIAQLRQRTTVRDIGGSFLNLEEELGRLERKSALKRGVELLSYIGIVSILLTFLGFVLTWFTSNLAGKPQTSTMVVSQPLAQEIEALRRENVELRRRTAMLEAKASGGGRPSGGQARGLR